VTALAVTGMGAVTALGVGSEVLFERWSRGECGISDQEVGRVGACVEFDPSEYLDRRAARRLDRFSQFAVAAAQEALEQAGWLPDLPYEPERIACIVGSATGGAESLNDGVPAIVDGRPEAMPALTVPKYMINAAAAAIAMRYGFTGESYSVVSACSCGGQSIAAAARMLEVGDADAVVVGGSEASNTPFTVAGFGVVGALSPSGVARPFDRRRDGFILGEGAGILVLERPEAADRRGATTLAHLAGYGGTTDAVHMTMPEETGRVAASAMDKALRAADAAPEDVVYINAHGTATELNDRSETRAIKLSLGEVAYDVPISSLKSAIGHLLGAAGAVEAVATILALRDRIAPPTLGYEEPEEGMDLDYVPGQARQLRVNGKAAVGLSNSFGFGGHNVVLCLEAT
jgi:3-oxoacyl-[acyl-carrier-protein] synthase II